MTSVLTGQSFIPMRVTVPHAELLRIVKQENLAGKGVTKNLHKFSLPAINKERKRYSKEFLVFWGGKN